MDSTLAITVALLIQTDKVLNINQTLLVQKSMLFEYFLFLKITARDRPFNMKGNGGYGFGGRKSFVSKFDG